MDQLYYEINKDVDGTVGCFVGEEEAGKRPTEKKWRAADVMVG